jgi:D-glycero-alpha-D-manno-heptose 1-phosphate guanylyltransferase
MTNAILLAGGLGTRLSAVSGGLPKPLVDVAGRPFIEHVLDMVVDAGSMRMVMAVSYRWELLRDYFGNTYRGLDIDWSVENSPLGTGGAIRLAFETFGLDRAFVLNADTLFRVDLKELERLHIVSDSVVTMALRVVKDANRFGVVELDAEQRVVEFHEKGRHGPGLVNGGIYVIERSVLDLQNLPAVFSFERDVLEAKLACLRPLGVPSEGYFIDIGIPEDLERARRELQVM